MFVKAIQGIDIKETRARLDAIDQPWQPSTLYAQAAKETVEEPSLRNSEARVLVDAALFACAERIVAGIEDDEYNFSLVCDDVTHLRYTPGAFFTTHTDACRVTSNLVAEFTLLVCVTPAGMPTVGGKTIFHPSFGPPTARTESTLPGSGLLFRKDVAHEGERVSAGEKQVISLNLWGRRKHRSEQILVVSFHDAPCDAPEDGAPSTGASLDGIAALRATAQAKSYALSANDVTSGMLATHVEWANRTAEQAGAAPPIVRYQCPAGLTYASFATVYALYQRAHVTSAELTAHQPTIDFFFPGAALRREQILVERARTDGTADGETLAAGRRVVLKGLADLEGARGVLLGTDERSGQLRVRLATAVYAACALPNVEQGEHGPIVLVDAANVTAAGLDLLGLDSEPAAREEAKPAVAMDDETEVIVCGSEERTTVVLATAAELGLPYVPFRLVLVRGAIDDHNVTGGGWQACWVSLGEYDNVFAFRRVVEHQCEHTNVSFGCRSMRQLLERKSFWTKLERISHRAAPRLAGEGAIRPGDPFVFPADRAWERDFEKMNGSFFLGLRVAPGNIFVDSAAGTEAALFCAPSGSAPQDRDAAPGPTSLAELEALKEEMKAAGGPSMFTSGMDMERMLSFMGKAQRLQKIEKRVERARADQESCGSLALSWVIDLVLDESSPKGACQQSGTVLPQPLTWLPGGASFAEPPPPAPPSIATDLKEEASAPPPPSVGMPPVADDGHLDEADGEEQWISDQYGMSDEDSQPEPASEPTGTATTTEHQAAPAPTPAFSLFHRDESGKTCFTEAEAAAASEHIAAMKLDERVKACLERVSFVLPQQSRTFDEWLCNNEAHGEFELLHVTGLVRLDASEPWTFKRAEALASETSKAEGKKKLLRGADA